MQQSESYYKEVGAYYDEDAPLFEKRYWANETLQAIRTSFREETECFSFTNALEIGFGPGVDLVYFAGKYPERQIYGIDVSEGMCREAEKQLKKGHCNNVTVKTGSVEDIERLFPGKKFDMIYVYFGALNTVADLKHAANCLEPVLNANGKIVITVINKWYWAGILLPLLKLRFSVAFRRLKTTWGGYAPTRYLESKCYTPKDIREAFDKFRIIRKRGYSITYPAWYQDSLRKKMGRFSGILWKLDKFLNYTPFWSKGEYTLFAMERKSS